MKLKQLGVEKVNVSTTLSLIVGSCVTSVVHRQRHVYKFNERDGKLLSFVMKDVLSYGVAQDGVYSSVGEHRSAESVALRFNSSEGLRFCLCPTFMTRRKNTFLSFITALKIDYLPSSITSKRLFLRTQAAYKGKILRVYGRAANWGEGNSLFITKGRGERRILRGSRGFQGGTEWNQSSPTEYRVGTSKN